MGLKLEITFLELSLSTRFLLTQLKKVSLSLKSITTLLISIKKA